MKLLITYIPFQVLIGFLLGIFFPVINLYIIVATACAVFIIMFLLHYYMMHKPIAHQSFFLLIVFFGMSLSWFSQIIQHDFSDNNHYIKNLNKNVYTQITLVRQLTTTKTSQRFYANVNTVKDTVSSGKILVDIPVENTKDKGLELGDILYCKARLVAIYPPSSPYNFDYKTYLARKHIYAKIKLDSNYIKVGEKNSWIINLQKNRNIVHEKIEKSSLSTDTKGLIKAMLLGDKNDVSNQVLTSFTNAGVVHIIAISGMHVGVGVYI